eukprot:2303648-Amphidinium_carterae.1
MLARNTARSKTLNVLVCSSLSINKCGASTQFKWYGKNRFKNPFVTTRTILPHITLLMQEARLSAWIDTACNETQYPPMAHRRHLSHFKSDKRLTLLASQKYCKQFGLTWVCWSSPVTMLPTALQKR